MTDRELLELAAKAAGIPMKPDFAEKYDYYMADPLMWNPLTDDGDALRLAFMLGIDISFNWECAQCVYVDIMMETLDRNGGDKGSATRRAIVRAAAEIGKSMP